MSYQDILDAINNTQRLHRQSVKQITRLRKTFERHGWYDEEIAEDVSSQEQNLWAALTVLHGRLPEAATA